MNSLQTFVTSGLSLSFLSTAMFCSVLICLAFVSFESQSVYAGDIQCTSDLLKNITDETQSSIVVTLLNAAKNLMDDAKKYATMKTRCPVADIVRNKPMDCAEIIEKNPFLKSGMYQIWPRSRMINGWIEVYCDMEDDGGGWTLLQRRGDFDSGEDYFYKDWQSYKNGFGYRTKDFWLGNDNIFVLTNQRKNIVKFTLSDWEGNNTYATYDEFWIEDESRNYTMHVSGYRGTAGDSFSSHKGYAFTTKDRDNDANKEQNCAVKYNGAWWYASCHFSHLNGLYLRGAHGSYGVGIEWYAFRGARYSLKDTVIKIRPKDFQKNPDDVIPL